MIFILLSMFTVGTAFSILNLILIPFLSVKLGSPGLAGNILSAGMLFSMLIGPVVGTWSDHIGKGMPFIGTFSAIMSASCVLLPLIVNKILVSFISILLVMCTFSSIVAYSSLIADYSSSRDKDKNYSLVMGMTNLSGFVSAYIIGKIYVFSIHMAFLTGALMIFIPFFPAFFYVMRHPVIIDAPYGAKKGSIMRDIGNFFRHNEMLIPYYFFIQIGAWFAIGGMWPYLTSFLRDELHIPVGVGTQWLGVMSLIMASFSLFIGKVSNRMGRVRMYMISLFGLMICIGIIVLLYGNILNSSWNTIEIIAVMSIMSFFLAFFYSLNSSVLSSLVSPKDQGKAFGMSNLFGTLSQASAIWILGTIISIYSYKVFFFLGFFGMLWAVLGGIWLNKIIGKDKGDCC